MAAFNPAWSQRGSELPTHVIKYSNWRKSFTSIATWPEGGALKLRMRSVCQNGRSKSGSKIDEWSTKKTTSCPTQKMCAGRPTRRASPHWSPRRRPRRRHQRPPWPITRRTWAAAVGLVVGVAERPRKPRWARAQTRANSRARQTQYNISHRPSTATATILSIASTTSRLASAARVMRAKGLADLVAVQEVMLKPVYLRAQHPNSNRSIPMAPWRHCEFKDYYPSPLEKKE